MKCPSCKSDLPAAMPECPWCGLTVEKLDTRFGALPRHLQFFTDRSSSLPLKGMAEIRKLLALFYRKFPQSLFSAFVLPEVQGGTIAEYTFWLANRGRFNPEDPFGADNFDLLLGIDLKGREAALVIGYGLESYLADEDLTGALASATEAFRANDVIGGIRKCVESVMERMRHIALKLEEERRRAVVEPLLEPAP